RSRSFSATCEPITPAVPVTRTFIDFPESETPVHGVAREDRLNVVDDGVRLAQLPDPDRTHIEKLLVTHGQDYGVVDAMLYRPDRSQTVFVLGIRCIDPWIVDIDVGVACLQRTNNVYHAGIPQIRAVFLERQSEHQDPGTDRIDAFAQHQLDHLVGD